MKTWKFKVNGRKLTKHGAAYQVKAGELHTALSRLANLIDGSVNGLTLSGMKIELYELQTERMTYYIKEVKTDAEDLH